MIVHMVQMESSAQIRFFGTLIAMELMTLQRLMIAYMVKITMNVQIQQMMTLIMMDWRIGLKLATTLGALPIH